MSETSLQAKSEEPLHPLLTQYYDILRAGAARIPSRTGNTPLCKRVGVTSIGKDAGTSTLAANLSLAAAMVGGQPTVLLEANSRRPSLHKNFEGVGSAGLAEVVQGKMEAAQALYESQNPQLALVPFGKSLNARALAKMSDLALHSSLVELHADADWLIVDLPPVKDALTPMFAQLLDGVILLIQANRHTSKQLDHARKRLEIHGIPLLGTVFRRSDSH